MADITHRSWSPPDYTLAEAHAVRALSVGEATQDQQRTAVRWLIHACARTYDMSFHPESARETDFAEGRRFVGLQLVKLINLPAAVLANMRSDA